MNIINNYKSLFGVKNTAENYQSRLISFAKINIVVLRAGKLLASDGMLLKRGTGNGERGTGNGERGAGNGERKSGNELSAETSAKIQNGGPKNEREKEEDKERHSCLG